jgi:hypothetical protein
MQTLVRDSLLLRMKIPCSQKGIKDAIGSWPVFPDFRFQQISTGFEAQ